MEPTEHHRDPVSTPVELPLAIRGTKTVLEGSVAVDRGLAILFNEEPLQVIKITLIEIRINTAELSFVKKDAEIKQIGLNLALIAPLSIFSPGHAKRASLTVIPGFRPLKSVSVFEGVSPVSNSASSEWVPLKYHNRNPPTTTRPHTLPVHLQKTGHDVFTGAGAGVSAGAPSSAVMRPISPLP
jgi:hypothetical protein